MSFVRSHLEKYFDLMKQVRHEIHGNPELGFEEISTSQLLLEIFNEAGFETFPHIGGSGFLVRVQKGKGKKSIGLRAELDALPIDEKKHIFLSF